MPFDAAAIMARIRAAELIALEEVAKDLAEDAKGRAPSRKLTPGSKSRTRSLTSAERTAAIGIAKRAKLSTAKNSTFRTERDRQRVIADLRAGKGRATRTRGGRYRPYAALVPEKPSKAFLATLSARGRYEVRSGRAKTTFSRQGIQIGGGLKDSIHALPVISDGSHHSVTVIADAADQNGHHYARFVEFPTRRTRAQPFLLPALKAARPRLKTSMKRELREALKK